jgi:hypothetical protein
MHGSTETREYDCEDIERTVERKLNIPQTWLSLSGTQGSRSLSTNIILRLRLLFKFEWLSPEDNGLIHLAARELRLPERTDEGYR